MKTHSLPLTFLGLCAVTLTGLTAAFSQTPEAAKAPPVDAYAQSIIKRASGYLAEARGVGFSAEIWEDVAVENGPVLQSTRTVEINLTRPDRLRAEIRTGDAVRTLLYNGSSLIMHDAKASSYGSIATPATIDETLDAASDKGIEFPLEDVLRSKPFGEGAAGATAGQYLGVEKVLGETCHHLAFQSENVDWQAWVADGPLPLVRKVVLSFKKEDTKPNLTAIFSDWKLGAVLPSSAFEFNAPPGTTKIEVVVIEESAPAADAPEVKAPEAK